MGEIVNYNGIKQILIDEMPKYYSKMELHKLGRLLAIEEYTYEGNGNTLAEIIEKFVTTVYQRELEEKLIQIICNDQSLMRKSLLKLVKPIENIETKEIVESEINSSNYKIILHISDIHFSEKEQVNRWLLQLNVDLNSNLNINKIDYLIISGDFTNQATIDEFEYATEFVKELALAFGIFADNIILVPGNHDLNWDITKASMTDNNVIDELLYLQKFNNFRNFYFNITGKHYPNSVKEQGIIHTYEEDKLLILNLNSAWTIDHINKKNASINMNTLFDVSKKILHGNFKDYLKLVVFHHPISGFEQMNSEFMEILAQMGFQLCMHGHIHEGKNESFNYDDIRNIKIIGAGTFGAIRNEQVSGIPHQYNLIKLYSNYLEVHTRKKEKVNGGWSADARWENKERPKSFYRIEL